MQRPTGLFFKLTLRSFPRITCIISVSVPFPLRYCQQWNAAVWQEK